MLLLLSFFFFFYSTNLSNPIHLKNQGRKNFTGLRETAVHHVLRNYSRSDRMFLATARPLLYKSIQPTRCNRIPRMWLSYTRTVKTFISARAYYPIERHVIYTQNLPGRMGLTFDNIMYFFVRIGKSAEKELY